jgi:hypothetical protein
VCRARRRGIRERPEHRQRRGITWRIAARRPHPERLDAGGPGRFVVESDGSIAAEGGTGLIYYTPRTFRDFVLELEYRAESPGANSGIFVRVPEQPKTPQDAVSRGYEIDIDDTGDAIRTTGSISGLAAPARMAAKPAGQWNRYRIEVTGQRYQVFLNGEKVNDFFGDRGREGYIGLQNHDVDSRVHFRNVRVTPLQVANAPASPRRAAGRG